MNRKRINLLKFTKQYKKNELNSKNLTKRINIRSYNKYKQQKICIFLNEYLNSK